MELLKKEVKMAIGMELKSVFQCLINENRPREQQEFSIKCGSAIVITVRNKAKAKRLNALGLRFGGIVKIVEKYWESRPSSVRKTCCGIVHKQMR